jgi:outer membrane protein TolC
LIPSGQHRLSKNRSGKDYFSVIAFSSPHEGGDMKPALQWLRRFFWRRGGEDARGSMLLLVFLLPPLTLPARAEPLTLKRAVQLALAHSPLAGETIADEQRAFASMREARDQYIPQLNVGSGLGDSWGYPLSLEGTAPSLFNISAQSAVFNPALREFVRAARSEYKAAGETSRDRHNQIIQDTALTYLELVKWEQLIEHLRQQHEDALKMQQVVEQRIKEGVDSEQTRTQARLATARANLRITQAEGAVDVLRSTMSQLTGLPPAAIQTDSASVPALPEAALQDDLTAKATEASPAVLSAQQHAIAQGFRALGEHRALWPSLDFATQYAVLAKFNNWTQFFPTKAFERNNATVGVVIRFPFLNFSQKAHAEAADADAIHAKKEVEVAKNQVSQETLKLQRAVQQLTAAQEVSELEYEIAKSDADAIEIKMNAGTASVHDAANSRTEMTEKYGALQDATFQLLRAKIGLLRATGELESWAGQTK